MIKTSTFEDIYIITMGRRIFGNFLFPVYCYIIDDLLIDTGSTLSEKDFLAYLRNKNITTVINTHPHEDHIGNNKVLEERGIKIFAHRDALEIIKNPKLLNLHRYQKFVWGLPLGSDAEIIQKEISLSNHIFQIIDTPGHGVGHISLYEPKKKWLFSGDLHISQMKLECQPFDNLNQILETLKKLSKLDIETLFSSHEGILANGNHLIKEKISLLENSKIKARELYEKQVPLKKITKIVAGKEGIISFITKDHISKLNAIKSFLEI
ncbi:MAG: MBL fold metallo-hydrolase [Promethearchaeota archaeon]